MVSQLIWTSCLQLNVGVYEGLQEKIQDAQFLGCWSVHAISYLMEKSEMLAINYAIPPFIGNIFDNLVTDLIPRVTYAFPSNEILFFYVMFIILEEAFLGSLPNWFFIFSPR